MIGTLRNALANFGVSPQPLWTSSGCLPGPRWTKCGPSATLIEGAGGRNWRLYLDIQIKGWRLIGANALKKQGPEVRH